LKINLDLTVQLKTPTEDTKRAPDVVWPTMLQSDDPGLSQVEFEFFDGLTVVDTPDPLTWKRPSGCVQMPTLRDTSTSSYNSGCYGFVYDREHHETQFVSNDPGPTDAFVAEQYASTNNKRWQRMPLTHDPSRDGLKRVDTLSNTDINFRIGLTQDDRVVFEYGLDLNREGQGKGPEATIIDTPQESGGSFVVKDPLVPVGVFGIKFGEVGARFLNHYVDSVGEVSEDNKYTAQWVMPDSMYWHPFSTDDDTNFKVTLEPSFEADAVSGKILHAFAGKQKVKLYLMPREWSYFMRFTRQAYIQEGEASIIAIQSTTEIYGDPPYINNSTLDWCGQGGLTPPTCTPATITPAQMRDDYMGWWYYGDSGYMVQCACDWPSNIWACQCGFGYTAPWRRGPWGCNSPDQIGSLGNAGTCTMGDHHLHMSVGYCCTAFWHGASDTYFKHRILNVFAPPPFAFGPPSSWSNQYWTDNNQVFQHRNNTNLFGDEGILRAIEHRKNYLIAQGMTASVAEAQAKQEVICGFISYHCIVDHYMKDATNNFKTGDDSPMGWIDGADSAIKWAIWNTLLNTPPLSTHHYTHEGVAPYDVTLSDIWWEWGFDMMNLDNPPVPAGLPIGMGITASPKGSLCAVIRINDSQVYYVWRKTDEEFEVCDLNVKGTGKTLANADIVTWPSPEGWPNGETESVIGQAMLLAYPAWCYPMNGGECQFWGSEGALTHALVPYAIYCKDSGQENQRCTAHKQGGAKYQFTTLKGGHPKIYPLYPRETPPGLED
jgi:hypothetical protein